MSRHSGLAAALFAARRASIIVERLLARIFRLLFIRHRAASLVVSVFLYCVALFSLAPRIGVASNYIVIVPVLFAALSYAVPGGVIAGSLGLPANLLIFALVGTTSASPAMPGIAEAAGILVGASFGYISLNFRRYEREIARRTATEKRLRKALGEKELLLKELNHRVKNSLNVIKSIAQLQKNRSSEPAFSEAMSFFIERVHAIALVHERLYGLGEGVSEVDPKRYMESLVEALAESYADSGLRLVHSVETDGWKMNSDDANNLGLIINEALANAAKHATLQAAGGESALVFVGLDAIDGQFRLVVSDNGPGFAAGSEAGGLGLKLMKALSSKLGGQLSFGGVSGNDGLNGARIELRWPLEAKERTK